MKLKKIHWVIIIVVLVIFGPKFLETKPTSLMAAAPIDDATTTRSISANSVTAGDTFTVTYTATGTGLGSGIWAVIIEDDISGGCTHNILGTNLDFGFNAEDEIGCIGQTICAVTKTINAPGSAGACDFGDPIGTFVFGGATQGTEQNLLGDNSIIVCVDTDGCDKVDWCVGDVAYECGQFDTDVCLEAGIKENCIASGKQCTGNGICTFNCADLKLDALTAINTWAANAPNDALKLTALGLIVTWAQNC